MSSWTEVPNHHAIVNLVLGCIEIMIRNILLNIRVLKKKGSSLSRETVHQKYSPQAKNELKTKVFGEQLWKGGKRPSETGREESMISKCSHFYACL